MTKLPQQYRLPHTRCIMTPPRTARYPFVSGAAGSGMALPAMRSVDGAVCASGALGSSGLRARKPGRSAA